jgi:hypothetical protein
VIGSRIVVPFFCACVPREIDMQRLVLTAALAAMMFAPSVAMADDVSPETQMNEAGIQAVEAHWVRAFVTGDAAYLNTLLDAGYVSVNTKGVPRPKADIIALAKSIAAKGPQTIPPPSPNMKIAVHGDAAIVTDAGFGQVSVDVFHYANGAWHAWYSQHTSVAPPDTTKKS